ncbi:lysyl oxidase homolog 2B [Agrilus planipennis]|uniref:Lysyl oxidase homolog 2B n=1 Tax=Agrilus planipennis TaxID=224129 RepID=A0A1W4XWS8_AGRPL|nr:lysyl oxidase homolog 2B [Agrilus planipennis]
MHLNYNRFLFFLVLASFLFPFCNCNNDHEDLKAKKAGLIKKHIKRLRKEDGAIKLVGGRDEFEGNLEILHRGRWGSICDDEWDSLEASVVCKQLGYDEKHAKATTSSHFGLSKRKFWMDNIYCNGTEKELTLCRFNGWGNSDCDINEAAGVICIDKIKHQNYSSSVFNKQEIALTKLGKFRKIALKGGRIPEEGFVQIKKSNNGLWYTVCGEGFSLLEGLVICKTLNKGFAKYALQTNAFRVLGNYSGIAGLQCRGNETHLSECVYNNLFKGECPSGVVATVQCVKDMADLVINHLEIIRTAHLEDRSMYFLQCAMEENCLASRAYDIQREDPYWFYRTRRLLKFTASIFNGGTADFRPFLPKHMWEWHMCHMHFHSMEIFATFDIYDGKGVRVAEGHKASFCLEDNQCSPGVLPRYACANFGDQGISVNCTDIYLYSVDCQWVDITELMPGLYTMKVAVNPEFKVPEMNYENNAAVCQLIYSGTYVAITNCKLQKP